MVLEAIQVLVSFATHFTAIWLFLLHANSAWVWYRRGWIDNRKASVWVLFELLILVTVLDEGQHFAIWSLKFEGLLTCL